MDYEKLKLKTYDLWDLYLHERQSPFLGRAYAAAKRPGADHLRDMTRAEREELFDIVVPEWERAVGELFAPDRTNLAILGNTWNHLHAHLVPRYQSRREFAGIAFVDPNPSGNYAPYDKKDLPQAVLLGIRADMIEALRLD